MLPFSATFLLLLQTQAVMLRCIRAEMIAGDYGDRNPSAAEPQCRRTRGIGLLVSRSLRFLEVQLAPVQLQQNMGAVETQRASALSGSSRIYVDI